MGLDSKELKSKPPKSNKSQKPTNVRQTSEKELFQPGKPYADSMNASSSFVRSKSSGPTVRKANVLNRKKSDPEVHSDPVPHSSKSTSNSRPLAQRRLSKTSRVSSTESDRFNEKSYTISSQNADSLPRKEANEQRRPFSFSTDYKDEIIPSVTPALGDAQRPGPTRPSFLKIKRQQSFDRGNHVKFRDCEEKSIQERVYEKAEPHLPSSYENDSNSNMDSEEGMQSPDHTPGDSGDHFTAQKVDVRRGHDGLETDRSSNSLRYTAISKVAILHSKSNTGGTRDEIMIAKTDDLIQEVSKFIKEIKGSREMNLSESPDRTGGIKNPDLGVIENFRDSFESIECLSSVSCPSAVCLQSGATTYRDQFLDNSMEAEVTKLPNSVNNQDIHGRISITLKMIEDEEKRDRLKKAPIYDQLQDLIEQIPSHKSTFLPSLSNANSRPQSRCSLRTSPVIFQAAVQPSSSSIPYTSPKLPKIDANSQLSGCDTARSCSCFSGQLRPSSRASSIGDVEKESTKHCIQSFQEIRPGSSPAGGVWGTSHEKTRKIFSYLDEVERSDRETLFSLKYEPLEGPEKKVDSSRESRFNKINLHPADSNCSDILALKTLDSLIRKGSVELAKEQIIMDRKLEEAQHKIRILEETLLHQRELNIRNLRNSEKDLQKRLKLQKDEFDMAFARNEALVSEMAAEKRVLQERCDKLLKHFDDTEEKYRDQIKNIQQKHIEEIKRLRKAQLSAENVRKQQWVGNKTQEIREMTVKGLEPEVQRIIQRHQQEMSEMRAWHADEIRETEDRYQRKMNMQLQDVREKCNREFEELLGKEKESAAKKLEIELNQREDEFENHRRRLANELFEERERFASEETKWKEIMHENLKKSQTKHEIEIASLKQDHEVKLANLERRHENELKTLKDINEAERDSWTNSCLKKYEKLLKEREAQLTEFFGTKMDTEMREREKKLREDFEKVRQEDESIAEARFKRGQEKLQAELAEMDRGEKELKSKLNQVKSELLSLEEQIYTMKGSLNQKDKYNLELQEANTKMVEERANLTSVIRREFVTQIGVLEEDVREMSCKVMELQTKHKLELDQRQMEIDKANQEKDLEIDKIGVRVKQTLERKEETILELQKQLEKAHFQIQHLEGLLEEQRKDILQSMTSTASRNGKRKQ